MKKTLAFCVLLLAPVSAHALTLAHLRFLTSDKLGQDTSRVDKHWSNTAQNAWINAAIRTVSFMGLCYTRDTTFALVASKTEYTMPSDYIKAEGFEIGSKASSSELDRSPVGVTPVDPATLGKAASVRVLPTQMKDKGGIIRKIVLTPSPLIEDTVKVTFYAYAPSLDADTSPCALPLAFQYLVPVCAAADLWSSTRTGNPYWQEFIDRLTLLVPAGRIQTVPEVPAATPGP